MQSNFCKVKGGRKFEQTVNTYLKIILKRPRKVNEENSSGILWKEHWTRTLEF